MTFLSPLLLWFLAAASVPIIIHLLNKRRHKTVQWAAMQFLLKATRESRGKKKLRHILILTCRALALAALAFAAARPIVSGLLGWGAGTIDTVVLILDRSASMELRSEDGQPPKREAVLSKFSDAISSLGNPRVVIIDSATAKPQEIPSPDVLTQISSTQATDSAADLPKLLTIAAEYLGTSTGKTEIWLASDLQRTNWRPEDERWAAIRASLSALPLKPSVRILSLTNSSAPNISLRLHGSRRIAEGLVLDLEIFRSENNNGSVNLPLDLTFNGATSTDSLIIEGQSLRFQKRITIKEEDSTGHGSLSIPADANPRDNTVFFAYGPARPIKSLVVAPEGESARYLSLSAAPPSFAKQSAQLIDTATFPTISTSDLALIVWASPLPTGRNAEMLESFLSSGGQVVFLPHPESSTETFLGMTWEPTSLADTGKFFILQDWNRSDGPLRDGISGTAIPAERLRAIKRAIPTGDAAVLARWEDNQAFITRKIVDKGTIWFLGTIPDYTWSNLGDADVLLPAIQRILALGTERFDSSFLTEVGSDVSHPIPGETATRLDSSSESDNPHAAGVFRLGDRVIAVNRPLSEDDPEITSKDNLDTMLDGTGYRLLDQSGQSTDPSLSTDVWRAFLIAVLFFLISEALLCLPNKTKIEPIQTPKFKPAA
jgi:hypothetical protein